MATRKNSQWIVFIGTFPPRECGIATFTQDLMTAVDEMYNGGMETKAVAMNPSEVVKYRYGNKVILQIDQESRENYTRVGQQLNAMTQVKMVCVQHEFGIFGGEMGEYVIELLKTIKKPKVLVLHTVLPEPAEKMREIVIELERNCNKLVVMTNLSRKILIEEYGINPDKIEIIPHGIHQVEYKPSYQAKRTLGLAGKTILTTFGLLSKGKGIEYVIEALPEVVKNHPNLMYMVVGATHPVILRQEGETYRNSLIEMVYRLKLTKHVQFYDKYVKLEELFRFLKATDIYISTSLNPNQAVSGTLSYALGTGRPVISTDFAQAKEYVTEDVGRRVNFRDSNEYTAAINELLASNESRIDMGKKAYEKTRKMLWQNVAIAYMQLYKKEVAQLKRISMKLPEFKMLHIDRMTDGFGMWQFANKTTPNPEFGYTLDDNARAMVVAAEHYANTGDKRSLTLLNIYLKFVETAGSKNGFVNYFSKKKLPADELNNHEVLEDANGRAIWALARTGGNKKIPRSLRLRAQKLFMTKWPQMKFTYPRSIAFGIKALYNARKFNPDAWIPEQMQMMAEELVTLYEKNRNDDWKWFEHNLTYSNALLPEALAMVYRFNRKEKLVKVATESMEFLLNKTMEKNIYTPIGNKGWYIKGHEKPIFDQQPEDTASMISGLYSLYRATKDVRYKQFARTVFEWFLGNNVLSQMLYDPGTGGCHDGLEAQGVNLDEGAESTVSYALARITMMKF